MDEILSYLEKSKKNNRNVVGFVINYDIYYKLKNNFEMVPAKYAGQTLFGIDFWIDKNQEEECIVFYDKEELRKYLDRK